MSGSWIDYMVIVPAVNDPAQIMEYRVSGYEKDATLEMERLVRAYRSIGVEPTVTGSRQHPVEVSR